MRGYVTDMHGIELANHLRLVSGYHMGTDLVDRIAHAERVQRQQRDALAKAADEIERLTAELAKAKAESYPSVPAVQVG
jgi:hypothetical protein